MAHIQTLDDRSVFDAAGPASTVVDISATPQSFTRVQVSSVLTIGAICSLVGPLQPLLVGPLAQEGRLTVQEIGLGAMLEAFGMAITIAVVGLVLRPRRLKLIVLVFSLLSVLANVATIYLSHKGILAARLVNGVTSGVLLWIWTGLLTHIPLPGRLVAIMVTVQCACVLALSALVSAFIIPAFGASGAYGALAIVSIITGALSVFVPSAYHATGGQGLQVPPPRGVLALAAVMMHMAAIMSVWVYVLPLGLSFGLPEAFITITISLGLAAQIAGGSSAAIFARLPATPTLVVSIAASLAALAVIALSRNTLGFAGGLLIISFFFMFVPGFHMPFLLESDATRRAGMLMITAQLLGFSVGPALTSLVVSDRQLSPALGVSGTLFVCAALLMLAITRSVKRSAAL